MDINATLIGQMITFAVFVVFTMKYVWPPITRAMQQREKTIADGLAAGERGHKDLELAQGKSVEILQEARETAANIVNQANSRADHLIEQAKHVAQKEGERLIALARIEIEQEVHQAKRQLQDQIASLALNMAEKVVQRDIDASTHKQLLDKMVAEI